ncbi:MAG: YhfC family intramembrane metalloprotease [Deltaproteobacteria bacterium]|nr:YhfC family intramembrane metalloprotease [Deltaproteobacteria bacterium]
MDAVAMGWNLATGLAMAVVGLLAVAWGRRRFGPGAGGWAGASAWTVSVSLKIGAAALTYRGVEGLLQEWTGAGVAATVLEALYNGLLTGVFEVGLVAGMAWRGSLRRAGFAQVARFGIGFGAAEAVSLGTTLLGLALLAGLAPDRLPGAALWFVRQMRQTGGPLDLLWPALERGSALAIHAVAALLVVAGFRARRPGLVAAAFLYKAAVDAAAAALVVTEGAGLSGGAAIAGEGLFLAMALAGLLAVPPLRRHLAVGSSDGEDAGGGANLRERAWTA